MAGRRDHAVRSDMGDMGLTKSAIIQRLSVQRLRIQRLRVPRLCVAIAMAVATPAWAAPGDPPRIVEIPLTDAQIKAAGIEMRGVDAERAADELVVPGVVTTPPQQVRVVAAPAAGLIESFAISPDEDVKEGAPIARLRSQDLVEAQRAFVAALAQEALAAEKLRRDEQLFRERIIAERRLVTTRAEAALARSSLDERTQLLGLHGMSEPDIAQLRKDRKIASSLTVRAPIAGVVLQRHATPGERVAGAAPLVTIARLDPIWANLQVPVARAAMLDNVDKVVLPAYGLEGKMVRVSRSVDPATQSLTAVAEFSPGTAPIRPGQAILATIRIGNLGKEQWRVPAAAVIHQAGREWVFVRTLTGFRAMTVDLIAETAETASIRAHFENADKIAARGVLSLASELSERLDH